MGKERCSNFFPIRKDPGWEVVSIEVAKVVLQETGKIGDIERIRESGGITVSETIAALYFRMKRCEEIILNQEKRISILQDDLEAAKKVPV